MSQEGTKYTFLKLAEDVLEASQMPLTISEIWNRGKALNLTSKLSSVGKTPINTLQARLYVELRDNANSIFEQKSRRPSTFYLKGREVNIAATLPPSQQGGMSQNKFKEKDLHILLSSFVYVNSEFHCETKTIEHSKTKNSNKKGQNEWLHPDIVGVYFPFDDYSQETMDLQEKLEVSMCKLYAFELKRTVEFSNLREYYFQAVSNSSWANEGYLVALNIDEEDEKLMSELKRLNNAFGIGVIKINAEFVSQSKVLFSARNKASLDWDTIDRLVANEDFKKFIKSIVKCMKAGQVIDLFDKKYKTDEEAAEYAKKKHIL